MADAIGHGFSAQEIQWQRNSAGLWMPQALEPRPQRWFTVDIATRQQIRLRDNTMDGAELLPYGWLLHQHSNKTGSPSTQGLYRALALPYLFKNFATKNWLRFCEMYAIPIRVLFHHEKDDGKKQELMSALGAMGINGVALLEGGMQDDLKTVDAAKGEGQGFQALIDWCERSVSKAILGGTLTSQADGKTSTNALGSIHDDVRYQIREHDARQIASTLTKHLLGAIIAVNGLSIRPRWVFDTQEPEDLVLYAEAIPKLIASGFKIPASYLHEKLKIPIPEGDEEVLPLPVATTVIPAKVGMTALAADQTAPQFTAEQQVIEDLADSVLNALGSPIEPAVIASAIRAAKDPQDLEARLAAVLAGTDVSEFSRTLERALWVCDILGYAHGG